MHLANDANMLYVFLVNNGTMMTFQVELMLQSVENLRLAIYQQTSLPPSSQVLLISGGEILDPVERLCKYHSAGTDTSPIYLFSKAACESPCLPEGSILDEQLSSAITASLKMEATINTVIHRAELSDKLYEAEKAIIHSCEKTLSDQHLQHQGWASVVCNLDDIVRAFQTKANRVVNLYNLVLNNQAHYQQLLDNFETDKETLRRIPFLKVLNHSDNQLPKCDEISLFDWIQQTDQNSPIDELYCYDELMTFDAQTLEGLNAEIQDVAKQCYNPEMKEIKGLASRLASLDKLMADVKKLYDRQNQHTKTFNQNQARASNLQDNSILPDLCQTHKEALQLMLKNHSDLIDYQDRFYSAKRELCKNIQRRLEWVIHVEERIKIGDEGLMKLGFRLTKIREKMDIIQSLHLCPEIYLSSIAEVMRRKAFSTKFYRWAQETSEYARKIVESETCQRRLFTSVSEKHFTKWFFKGFDDLPCNFAESPAEIDKNLPELSLKDIEYLSEKLPDMKRHLQVSTTFDVPQFDSGDKPPVPNQSQASTSVEATTTTTTQSQQVEVQFTPKVPHFDQSTSTTILGDDLDVLKKQRDESEEKLRECCDELESQKAKIDHLEAESEMNRSFLQRFASTRSDLLSTLETVKTDLDVDFKSHQQSMKDYLEETVKLIYKHLQDTKDISDRTTSSLNAELEVKNQQIAEHLQTIKQQEERLKGAQAEVEANAEKVSKLQASMVEGQEQIMQRMKLKAYENMFATLMSHFSGDPDTMTPEESQQKLKTLKQLITSGSSNLENIVGSQSFIAIPNAMESSAQQEPLEWLTSQFQELSTGENGDNFASDDRVNLNSCEIGNNVFVHFHPTYQHYAVFQKNSFLHFVHPDSVREFQFIRKKDDSPWFLAQVQEKEFCMTKKAENRYKLPLDTKFYRVRVKQLTQFMPNSWMDMFEAFNMSQSIATSSPSTSGATGSRTARTGSHNSDQSPMFHSVNLESTSKRTF